MVVIVDAHAQGWGMVVLPAEGKIGLLSVGGWSLVFKAMAMPLGRPDPSPSPSVQVGTMSSVPPTLHA
jgi:hypothetical protein